MKLKQKLFSSFVSGGCFFTMLGEIKNDGGVIVVIFFAGFVMNLYFALPDDEYVQEEYK
jgi:hypothetical protein